MLNNMAKAYPEDCAHGDYNADLIKIDGSISSSGSVETASPGEMGLTLPEEQKLVKKKGGRKPIYATTEERKQRNREAQAAFRERRNEYIKKLQKELDEQKIELELSQQNHRTAADECLILRHKCSILEKTLAEKGINSEAEMRALADNPSSSPYSVGPPPPGQHPGYRTILSRPTEAQRAAARLLPDRQDPLGIEADQMLRNVRRSSPMTVATSMSQSPSPPASPSVLPHVGSQNVSARLQPLARPLYQQSSQGMGSAVGRAQQQLLHQSRHDTLNAASTVIGNGSKHERRSGSLGRYGDQSKLSLLPQYNGSSKEDAEETFKSGNMRIVKSSSPRQPAVSGNRATNTHSVHIILEGSGAPQAGILKNVQHPRLAFQHGPTTPGSYAQPFQSNMIPDQVNTIGQYSAVPQTHRQNRISTAHSDYAATNHTFENQNSIYLPMEAPIHGDPYTLHNNMDYNAQYSQQYPYERR